VSDTPTPALDVDGPAAPPRRNGELVFQEPWEGRAFGLAVTLRDRGRLPWEAFRARLIAAIAVGDRRRAEEGRPGYYENWLTALRSLLEESGILTKDEIDRRVRQFARGERDIANP
jgi:nitrile hydratase accessory protein